VTHDKEFEESADRIIEVEKVDGVSVVKNQKGF
jgi:DNA repair exonuclease SbcCD ATPase subunit